MADVLELVCEGNRNPDHVVDLLQEIKDNPNFYEALAKKSSGGQSQNDVRSHPRIQELLNAGWKIKDDISAEGALDISRFELKEFLEKGKPYVTGHVMCDRAKEMGGLTGLDSALWLLDNQNQIPKEWRSFYLAFPGARLRNSDDNFDVPYLYWYGGRWYLSLSWVESDWFSSGRVMRFRK